MKIEKEPLHIQIADRLREMIMTGALREGDKINENELCASMGVSKTPLREALRVLNVEGLISLIPNRGSYVTRPTIEEIVEMFDVMSLLEGYCARAACARMSERDFMRIERLHARLEKHFDHRDQDAYIRVNNQYHSLVQELAGNRTLNQIVSGLRKKILLYRFKSLNLPQRFENSIQEHRQLLEAFRQRDGRMAEALMQTHLRNQSLAMERLVETSRREHLQGDAA